MYQLAEELGVPDDIIKRPPTAGLWEGQTDEKEMGITYKMLDKAIEAIEKRNSSGIDKQVLDKVKEMIEKSEHKRSKAPVFPI